MLNRFPRALLATLAMAIAFALAVPSAGAEEGMWTLHDFPAARVKETHGIGIGESALRREVTPDPDPLYPGTGLQVSGGDLLYLFPAHCILGQCRIPNPGSRGQP